MRHFIMLVDDATTDQQNAVTKSFRGKPQGFWHIFSDAWLLMDPTNQLTVDSLRDHLKAVVPGAWTLVFPIDRPETWAGYGRSEDFKWLHEVWKQNTP